jgi:hypothetical protein
MDPDYLRWIAVTLSILLITFVVFVLIWNVSREKQSKMLQAQIDLLAQIASANGISRDKIADIVAKEKLETED